MTDAPVLPAHDDSQDPRTDGPMTGDERAVLEHWLNLYRETILLKIAGLTAPQLCQRSVPPSTMSPIGVVRHLTEVEAYWLRVVLLDEHDVPDYYCTPESPDGDFDDIDPSTCADDVHAFQAEISRTRALAAAWADLDAPVRGLRKGHPVNLDGSSCTSSRSTPGTSATWTCSCRPSTAAPATSERLSW